MYMATVGGTGLRALARLNYDKAAYLKKAFQDAGITVPFSAPTFNEFVIQLPQSGAKVHRELQRKKIVAGLPLASYYPELTDHYLLCVTETMDRGDLDLLVREVQSCLSR
jgi:glycine dehydrogenase subunit 1